MPDQIERALRRLEAQLPGRVSLPGGDGYAAATAIWAKPVGPMPRAVLHCATTDHVQLSIAIRTRLRSAAVGAGRRAPLGRRDRERKGSLTAAVRFTKRDR